MARVDFSLQVQVPASATAVWAALTAWETHGEWIPMTRVRILSGDGGLGTRFVARTGIGPLALDDVMVVTSFDVAARAASVEKVGRLTGSADFRISEDRPGASLVHWSEAVRVPGLPRFLAPIVARVGALAFRVSLQRLGRRLGAGNS